MKAILLAAGLGTRLRPLTDTVPKCLIEIGDRPLLDHWLSMLSKAGIRDVLINTHHLPERVHEYVRGCVYPVKITLTYEPHLLGTGGTILANRSFFGDAPILVAHADNLSFFHVRSFIRRFEDRPEKAVMTMMTFRTDAPRTCGIVEIDQDGVVQGFHEKVSEPPGNLANAAIYIIGTEVLQFMTLLGSAHVDFSTQVLPHFLGRINTWHNEFYHRDIGTPESLAQGRSEFMRLRASGCIS